MHVAILTTRGRFIADIGDDDFSPAEAINATYDLLESDEVLFGYWVDPSTTQQGRKGNIGIRIRTAHVVSVAQAQKREQPS